MTKILWGILSTANIGLKQVIPAMQMGTYSEISAIASRDIDKARKAARDLDIPNAYGTYEELLADKNITAIYIPLPNHLHVEWTIKSLKAGKHVLCEKPVAINYKEAKYLLNEVRKYPHLKLMEAFMYRHHPQIQKTKELIDGGVIGDLKNIHSVFTYYNIDPNDIRNKIETGGGALLDIGCYCISLSRFLFNDEPFRVCGVIERDPELKTDRLTGGILNFTQGFATFSCSTQLMNHRRAEILGTKGRIEIENPFVPSAQEPAKILLQTAEKSQQIRIKKCNQYTIQGDLFSKAILNDTDMPTPLTDAVANMKIIDAIFESAETNSWIMI